MYKKNKSSLIKSLIIITILSVPVFSQPKEGLKSVREALLSSGKLNGKSGPGNLNWIDGGNQYSYTALNDPGFKEIRSYDPKTKEDLLVFENREIDFPGTNEEFNYNKFRWSNDSKYIVFQTNSKKIYRRSSISDYYLYSLNMKILTLVAKNVRTAELSPNSKMIGYERDNNMFVYDIENNKETRLTSDTGSSFFNGHYDWVYEEEFGQAQAWSWSPDSKYIAFWHFDESNVPVFQMTGYEGKHPEYEKIPVPLVGDPNPKVKIGVEDLSNNEIRWVDPGLKGDYYIPRIYWTNEPNTLAIMILNRPQNDLKLFFYNLQDGSYKKVMEEKSNTWIDIYDFYEGVNDLIYFPKDVNEFFWISDKDGHKHIYRYDYNGKLLNRVTKGNWTVTKIEGINSNTKTIYYTSTEPSPLERQLYSVKFDGTDKQQISKTPGRHRFNMSPNAEYYIDSYSSVSQPKQVELRVNNGEMINKLEDNNSVSEYIKTHKYSPLELIKFETSGSVNLDASIIKPPDFDPTKKYPVIFSVYGGPGSQGIFNSFAASGFDQWLAQQGYIIANVNNRGNANYGSNFMKIVYKHLGKYESHDFAEFAKYLSKLPYVDSTRIGIMGTSYGGYISIYTILMYPQIFKVAIANSPVTDWRLYDDIYTERYMDLLEDNEVGYDESSNVLNAKNLKGKLLIVHSDMDDNVHVQNTMQMLTALINAGKDADLRIFPLGAHGAIYNFKSNVLEHEIYDNYLKQYLKGDCNVTDINK
jgi:dipeptidyl-peptidase 4